VTLALVDHRALALTYLQLKRKVIDAGFDSEISWQSNVDVRQLTERGFLEEAAWVVLSSGMRETIVRRRFPAIREAFLSWSSAESIVKARERCRNHALSVFNHRPKINAILQIADKIAALSFDWFLSRIIEEGVRYLERLPFMGPVTSFHLAKNIGLQVAKPDRHLIRIAQLFGFETPQVLCEAISNQVSEPVPVVDVVLWRYATIQRNYRTYITNTYRTSLQLT